MSKTRTIKLSTTLLNISCAISPIYFLMMSSLACRLFSRKEAPLHFKPPFSTEHLNTSGRTYHGSDSFHVKSITPGHPIPKISTHMTIFRGGTSKTEFVKKIHSQEKTSREKKSEGLHKKCSINLWMILLFQLLLSCHTAARCMERT